MRSSFLLEWPLSKWNEWSGRATQGNDMPTTSSWRAAVAMTVIGLVVATTVLVRLWSSAPQPICYTVPPPPELPVDDEGEEMEKEEGREEEEEDGSSAIRCHAPATGRFLGLINPLTEEGIDEAVAAAAAAQTSWAQTTMAQRKKVLASLLRHILDHASVICRVACLDSGKTMLDAQLGEVLTMTARLQWTLTHGEAALAPESRPTNLLMAHKQNEVLYEPLGVVAALVSWNYPFHNMMAVIVSALFAGNAIVVKVSEQTAWSSRWFAGIAHGALTAHGHDARLVQVVACWPRTAAHLTSHPLISHITFIGSRPVAHRVAASAAKTLTPLVAELGGKDAFIVLDSVPPTDIPRIVDIVLRGTFQAAGQNCVGIERVIVCPRHYDTLVNALLPRVAALRLGPSGDVGALISDSSFPRLQHLIQDAVSRGARLLAGGHPHVHPSHPRGHYFQPTLLADVTPDMPIAQTECFAPILTLMRAPSSLPADVLSIANSTEYGLGASVHGAEHDPATEAVVRGLKAGMVAVNDFAAYYAVQLPFGGVAGSGYGHIAGVEGLRGLCNIKSVCRDRFPRLGVRTSIPPLVRYPVASQTRSWTFMQGVVELGYGDVWRKVKALGKIVGST